jgi:uncharacterized protein (DUF2236 family)
MLAHVPWLTMRQAGFAALAVYSFSHVGEQCLRAQKTVRRPGSKEPALAVHHISLPPPFHSDHLPSSVNVWTLLPAMKTPLILPWPLQSGLEAVARVLLEPSEPPHIDFSRPIDEASLLLPNSVSWRVFKNPVSVFIGGITAVILELAEPRVRTGVWEHTTFRLNPIRRLRRTGLAAMATIYGARGTAEAMIARVRRIHDAVAGTTSSGAPYSANDPELLNWVHATAAYGFLQAYHTYVHPLSLSERDRYYAEGVQVAGLYGAAWAPVSESEIEILFHAGRGHLERSDIVFEFLAIMRSVPILPLLLRPMQHLLVRAAVDLTPRWARTILGLNGHGLRPWEAEPLRQAAAFADSLILECHPAVQACRRVGLPADYLYVQPSAVPIPDDPTGCSLS